MKFWQRREMKTRPVRTRASPESLLFWAVGGEYANSAKGDPIGVVKYLLRYGADVEGYVKDYSPLHRAVASNRPELVELLIRRGANLSRPYANGEPALQIAMRWGSNGKCAKILKAAGAPLELPKKPERSKPLRTVDLRAAARKLEERISAAVRSFARQHGKEVVTAVALASVPHEGYVMVSFDTGEFDGNPWDCTFDEFAYVLFPNWTAAHRGDLMRLIDMEGQIRVDEPDAFVRRFKKMIVDVLKSLERKGVFDVLETGKGCRVGIDMTIAGEGKSWRMGFHFR